MLLKILGFIAVVVLIYIFFFKNKRKVDIEESSKKEQKNEGDTMVECKKCTTFVSHDDAIIKDGCFFCSKRVCRSFAMILIGHEEVKSPLFYRIETSEQIASTPPNSTVIFDYAPL